MDVDKMATFASRRAKRIPIQERGPWPKAWKAYLVRVVTIFTLSSTPTLAPSTDSRVSGGLLLLAEVLRVELVRMGEVLGVVMQTVGTKGDQVILLDHEVRPWDPVVLGAGTCVELYWVEHPQGLMEDHVHIRQSLEEQE